MRWIGPSVAILLTCITTLSVVPDALAQTSTKTPSTGSEAHGQSAPPAVFCVPSKRQAPSRPYTNTLDHHELDGTEESKADKVAHLRRAARHLMAAGKPELAERANKEALLEAKLKQIRRLQTEVEELRATTATGQTVTLHVKIMELQVTKMRKRGIDLQITEGTRFEQITGDALVQQGAFDRLIEALRAHDLVKVLAEPTLVTVSGRPATIQSGGEFPVVMPRSRGNQPVEYRHFGTRLDCMAKVLDSGRIRLELRPTITEIDPSRSVMIQETTVPGLRTRSVDTAVEMEAGQTLVLSEMRQTRPKRAEDSAETEETALLVTVTANLGEPVMPTEKSDASKRR